MRVLASSQGLVEFQVDEGRVRRRNADGTFHVPDELGKKMLKSGEWGRVGTNFRHANDFTCQDCGFNALIRDHCGRCGGSNLE